jgi:lipoprotein-releasing system permease protein
MKFRVSAIFKTGDWQADNYFAYVPLEYMQETLELGNGRTYMQIRIKDMYTAQDVVKEIRQIAGPEYFYSTWIEENSMFFNALELEKLAMFLAITLIIAVAALNIVSTLIMLVMEKNRDIGILRSMGASRGGIMTAFILQGLIIGIVGTLIGAGLGSLISYLLDVYEVVKLPGEVYMISTVRFMLVPLDIAMVCLVALGISVLATIYPAWKASRLRPAEALRYE